MIDSQTADLIIGAMVRGLLFPNLPIDGSSRHGYLQTAPSKRALGDRVLVRVAAPPGAPTVDLVGKPLARPDEAVPDHRLEGLAVRRTLAVLS